MSCYLEPKQESPELMNIFEALMLVQKKWKNFMENSKKAKTPKNILIIKRQIKLVWYKTCLSCAFLNVLLPSAKTRKGLRLFPECMFPELH